MSKYPYKPYGFNQFVGDTLNPKQFGETHDDICVELDDLPEQVVKAIHQRISF